MNMRETLRRKAKGKKGFTLVELVIVIAVLAIIAAIAIPTVSNVIGNANAAADASNAQTLELTMKTAASEVAANDSVTDHTHVTALEDATTKNMATLIQTYGIDSSVFTLKVSGHHYIYNSSTGKVTATGDSAKTGEFVLATATQYSIASGGITFSNPT